ncbi:phage tail tape measure protein, TP901 family, core region [Desulfonauticus submarinus]|uniref:Phage tail tape measure protein, TP901 family, core region n=1 Tax=Desulfonauticus submarinus TaxID=206665 RepID=A0A1H0GBX4_9BACT|nr:phage tail tape measure protein [Desulfonauticus submarinus]SDO04366.1 phage tail tape measure protein, TP901 family, core region [Desulfonauticus submarinus]
MKDLNLSIKIDIDAKEGQVNLASIKKSFSDFSKEIKKIKKDQIANSRDLLGVRPHSEIFKDIESLKRAYKDLSKSGKLSLKELAQAKVKLNQKTKELKASTNGWVQALGMARAELVEIGAAVASLTISIREAVRFESAMADVRKTVDATQEQFKNLRKEILELGRVIPLSHQELAKIAALGGQLGIPLEDIAKFTEITAKMATAFDMIAEESGTAIGKLKNVFDLSIKEIESLGDTIDRLGNTTAAREKDIIEVLLRIGGSARQFDITKEQAAALADTMLALGKTPEVAATSINAFLNRLQGIETLTPKAKQALTTLGYTTESLAKQIRENPQKAILDFLNSLKRLDKESRTIIITEIFGREFQDDIALLVNGMNAYKKALSEIADKSKYAGAMQSEFATRAATTEKQFQLLKNAAAEIGVQLGSVFLPGLIKGMEVLRNMATAISDLVQLNPEVASLILTITSLALLSPSLGRLFDILKLGIAGLGSLSELQTTTAQVGLLKAEIVSLSQALSVVGAIGAAAFIGWNIGKVIAEIKVGKRTIGDWGAYFMGWIMDIVAGLKLLAGLWWDLSSFNWGNFKNRLNDFKTELELNKQIREMALKGERDIQSEKKKTIAEIKREMSLKQQKINLKQELARWQSELSRLETKRKMMSEEATKAEIQGIKEIIKGLEERKRKTEALLNESLRKEREYAEEVKRQQQEILNVQQTTEDKIREIRRRSMTEAELEADKEKEYFEKLEKAKEAYFQKNYALALKYARQAQDVAAGFKDQEEAIDKVKGSGELLKEIHEKIKEKAEENLQLQQEKTRELKKNMASLDKTLSEYHAKLEKLNAELKKISEKPTITQIDANIEKAKEKIEELKKQLAQIKDKTVTITVQQKTIETHQTGGLAGWSRIIGKLSGFGGGDRIKALLEAGEFVVRKEAVRKYGVGLLSAINNMRFNFPSIPLPDVRQLTTHLKSPLNTETYRKFEINLGGARLEGFAMKDIIDEFEMYLRRRKLCGA